MSVVILIWGWDVAWSVESLLSVHGALDLSVSTSWWHTLIISVLRRGGRRFRCSNSSLDA